MFSGGLHSSSSSSGCSSYSRHDSLESPHIPESRQSPFSAHHALDPSVDPHTEPLADPSVGPSLHQLWGLVPRTPLSPQPSRPVQPALTRQFSKSAPSSPRHHPAVSFAPPRHPSDSPPGIPSESIAQANKSTEDAKGEDASEAGAMRIPDRAGQQAMQSSLLNGASLEGPLGGSFGGSDGGSLGPLHGISPPDGYMADSELAASRRCLHHSSVSFSDSGLVTLLGQFLHPT